MSGCGRYFAAAERLSVRPVWSNEYDLNADFSPDMPMLDELRVPLWWAPAVAVTTARSEAAS